MTNLALSISLSVDGENKTEIFRILRIFVIAEFLYFLILYLACFRILILTLRGWYPEFYKREKCKLHMLIICLVTTLSLRSLVNFLNILSNESIKNGILPNLLYASSVLPMLAILMSALYAVSQAEVVTVQAGSVEEEFGDRESLMYRQSEIEVIAKMNIEINQSQSTNSRELPPSF